MSEQQFSPMGRVESESTEHQRLLVFITNLNSFIDELYSGVQYENNDVCVTSRSAAEYQRTLCLQSVPVEPEAKVLDTGSGNAQISARDFGLSDMNLVLADFAPQNPGVVQANILNLPFEDEEFDEIWLMYVLKYVDRRLPAKVTEKLNERADKAGAASSIEFLRKVELILGLKAIGEAIRVIKQGGRVRIGSYLYDFQQSSTIAPFIEALSNGTLKGLRAHTEEIDGNTQDSERREANLFLEKSEEFDLVDYWAFIRSTASNLIPNFEVATTPKDKLELSGEQ